MGAGDRLLESLKASSDEMVVVLESGWIDCFLTCLCSIQGQLPLVHNGGVATILVGILPRWRVPAHHHCVTATRYHGLRIPGHWGSVPLHLAFVVVASLSQGKLSKRFYAGGVHTKEGGAGEDGRGLEREAVAVRILAGGVGGEIAA